MQMNFDCFFTQTDWKGTCPLQLILPFSLLLIFLPLGTFDSEMGLQRWQLLIFSLLGFSIFSCRVIVQAQNSCGNNGNYTANSVYATNLQSLFSSLPSNMGNSGFYNTSIGVGPDRIYSIAICRTDLQLEACRSCIGNATLEITGSCPLNRDAVLWRPDCSLRYSNESFFGTVDPNPRWLFWNPNNVTSIQQFNVDLRSLIDDLRNQAAQGGSLIKVAAGNRTGPDSLTIYSLLQCTPDISADDCRQCLDNCARSLPQCCNGRPGARVLAPSCTLLYEVFSFFNATRIQEVEALLTLLPPPSSPPVVPPLPLPPGNSRTIIIIIVVVVAVVVCVALVGCVFIFLRRKKRMKKQPVETATKDNEMSVTESLQYDFNKIKEATNDFSVENQLGQGGFGAVYKGTLENGQQIAVKRLSRGSAQGDLEFKNEALLLGKLQHRNLVRLFGYAIHGSERLLVYEFVKNGSLDHIMFDLAKRNEVDWSRRYKIIGGIAKGLLYLHEDSRFRIIHRDLKPANILLDTEMNPKIADFGLARLFVFDETRGSTSRVVGTYGYMPPEYAFHGQLSVKIDVFSFGVLILEIVSGQKKSSFVHEDGAEDMLSFAWRSWREGTMQNMVDPILRAGSGSLRDMMRCIHIGLLCVQENAADRPTMASVVLMLNSSAITIPIPSRPAFFMANLSDSSSMGFSKSPEVEAEQTPNNDVSINQVSVSEFYPR